MLENRLAGHPPEPEFARQPLVLAKDKSFPPRRAQPDEPRKIFIKLQLKRPFDVC